MLLLMAELLDTRLELLLASLDEAWLDVDALPASEPLLPPQVLNNINNTGMHSAVNGVELDLPMDNMKDSLQVYAFILTTLSIEVNSLLIIYNWKICR